MSVIKSNLANKLQRMPSIIWIKKNLKQHYFWEKENKTYLNKSEASRQRLQAITSKGSLSIQRITMYENITVDPLCSGSLSSRGVNNETMYGQPTYAYVNECLGIQQCMTVEDCSERITRHVAPGAIEWFIIAIYIAIFLIGLLGNGLVCFVVVRTSHMRTVVNIFIVNLAIADFLVLLVCLPPSVLADTTESWYLGGVMCKVVIFLQVITRYLFSQLALSMFLLYAKFIML